MDGELQALRELIRRGERMVFFGGAGVSTESGIPDFRSEDGLFQAKNKYGHPPQVLLSHSFFAAQPAAFFAYYRENLVYPDALPNPAHLALAELERRGTLRAVVTQNVDGLHQLAGSRRVYELHGSVRRNHCVDCGRAYPMEQVLRPESGDGIPRCGCGGIVRPDVVLYEEPLDEAVMARAVRAVESADVMIVGGTSLAVMPAAGLIDCFRGHALVLINRTPTPYDRRAQLVLREPIGEVLGSL